jgi:hypothetical protein
MRNDNQSVDLEMVRLYSEMVKHLAGALHAWLAAEQLTATVQQEYYDARADHKWLSCAEASMFAIDCLVDIVTKAPGPVPLHWYRWGVNTAATLEELMGPMDLAIQAHTRP